MSSFVELLNIKQREIVFTQHAVNRAIQRVLPRVVIETDLFSSSPLIVFEQESEISGERKFDIYYLQSAGYFHRYVITLNSELRVITLMRVNKNLQKFVVGGFK